MLVLVFHILEEFVKRVIAGKPVGIVWHNLQMEDLVAWALVILCAFIPTFAFRELRRVLGEESFTQFCVAEQLPRARSFRHT
jgi:hypothetical protein